MLLRRQWKRGVSVSMINGLIVPLLTPMNEDASLDNIGLKSLTARLMNKGVRNFIVLSPYSETSSLSIEQEKEAIRIASSTIGQRGNLIVGCFADATDGIIEKVKFAEKFTNNCLVNIPFSSLTNEVEFIDFFDKLFTKTNANIFLYNDPFTFKRNIPIVGIDRIANWEKLIGIIDFSKNLTYFRALSDYHQSLRIFQGAEEYSVESFNYYCSGLVVGLANVSPELFIDLQKESIAYGYNAMVRQELKLLTLMKEYFPKDKRVQSYKKILSIEGVIKEYFSKSLETLSEEEVSKLLKLIKTSIA